MVNIAKKIRLLSGKKGVKRVVDAAKREKHLKWNKYIVNKMVASEQFSDR